METESGIAAWYRDKTVFITGATGFLGKVLMSKLLRSCPDLGPIYVLVREKREILPRDRVKEIMSSDIFGEVRDTRINWEDRIIAVPGDISQSDLGLSAEYKRILQERVSVVFHIAATVKFNESLRVAMAINLEGTKALMQLCLGMTQLRAIVHVSTAFTNCNLTVIEERIYPPPADLEKVAHCVAGMDDDLLETIAPRLIGSHPNNYTFTKALAEHVVAGYSSVLPVVVVRPSIVTASWREPSPGWIDNINGPTGIMAGAGAGCIASMYGRGRLVADLIPVDVCINLCIAAALEIGTREIETTVPNVLVYNCVSGPFKSISWSEFFQGINNGVKHYPFSKFLTNPSFGITDSRVKFALTNALVNALPATLADVIVRSSGGIPRFRGYQRKLKKTASLVEFFVTHEFKYKVINVEKLRCRLSPADQMIFNFEIGKINWTEYVNAYCLGIRRYLMKEEDDTIDTCRQRVARWVRLTRAVQTGILVIVGITFFSSLGLKPF